MKRYIKQLFIILGASLIFVSCNNNLFERCFLLAISVENKTDTELVLEIHENPGDYYTIKYIQADSIGALIFDEYWGTRKEDYPPESVVVEGLNKISIYREVDGERQVLPDKWINNLANTTVNYDMFLGAGSGSYEITITDEMFLDE